LFGHTYRTSVNQLVVLVQTGRTIYYVKARTLAERESLRYVLYKNG
jgi:hypothetical protein